MLSKLEERNNEIIQELKDQGYANRKINYEEFGVKIDFGHESVEML